MPVPAGGVLPPDALLAHAGSIRALALSILGDEHAAEDVLQETWVRALQKPPPRQDSIGGWLRRVAEGIAISRLRSEGRRRTRETHWVEDRDCAQSSYDALERAEVLRAVVDEVLALDEPYREAVMRRYFEGLPPREIAAATQTSVATVNSRLQRAQAQLEERLQRRLSDRCGGMRGALLALVGWPEDAAAASAGGWLTTSVPAQVLAGAAGVAAALVLVLWFGPQPTAERPESDVAVGAFEPRATGELSDVRAPRVARSAASVVAPANDVEPVGVPLAEPVPGPFVFQLVIEPIDAAGRALAGCGVWLGPAPGPLAFVGETAWDGALRLTWRGHEPEVALVVRAGRAGFGSTALRRVQLSAAGAQVVRLGLDSTPALDVDQPPSVLLPAAGAALGARPRRDEGRFLLDGAGNGVFEDPWLLGGPEPERAAVGHAALTPIEARTSGAPLDGEAPRAWLEVRALDAQGRPIPHALISFSAAEGAYREDVATGPAGVVHALAVPPGSVLVAVSAPGAPAVVARQRLEVEPGARLTLDLALPRERSAHLRLVDADGSPRAGWHVEARDGTGSTLARARLDAQGRGSLPLGEGQQVALLARADPTGTGVVVDPALLAHDFEQVYTASFAPHERTLRVLVRGPGTAEAVVRVARDDSGEALDAAPVADEEAEASGVRAFRARGLSRGLHRVLVGAAWHGWTDAGLIELKSGRGPETIEVALPPAARLTMQTGDAQRVRLVGRRSGMNVVSPDARCAEGRELRAAPGSWDLLVEREHGATRLRRVELRSGVVTRVE
ncbi:MAG: sigma-70 family RNA polymerase sigma factor [Planctomycetes bacterium]|nr:sigma-70 family RNA polymerase sigma factor [Planctomycetota bacterium]